MGSARRRWEDREERRRGHHGDYGCSSEDVEQRWRQPPRQQKRYLEEEDFEDQKSHGGYNQRPQRLKVDSLMFNYGDPHEWLDKATHYFEICEITMHERVSTAAFS